MAQARASEKRWSEGAPMGALDGVPVSVKESIAVSGMPYWRGAKGYMSKPFPKVDSPPATSLKEAGAIIFAKTTMPDFGMLPAGVSTAHGVTRNPWDLSFNTGGSSSGGAAAVAARLGPLTIGSDIGGSVRLPASLCGLASIKPTQGRIPHLPPSPIRSAGPLARSVEDAALLLSVLSRPDSRDYGSVAPETVAYHKRLSGSIAGLRLGLVLNAGFGASPEAAVCIAIEQAAACLEAAGAEIVRLPPLVGFDPSNSLSRLFAARSGVELEAMSAEARESLHPAVLQLCRSIIGVSAVELGRANEEVERLKAAVIATSSRVDYLLTPTAPVVNFPAEAIAPDPDDVFGIVAFTAPFNQTGQPAAVVCCGFDVRGLPIGLQIVGSRFDDIGVMRLAAAYERNRGFAIEWPALELAPSIAQTPVGVLPRGPNPIS
jgi:aspartyl-tRNA(Asn)/glutamyl-tRNA(Gln) amidotransferase subunit A